MILRKGAIAAHAGEKVLIPINMRDGSVIAVGKGNSEWNYSAPHGAGRIMSRAMAKRTVNLDEYKEAMKAMEDSKSKAEMIAGCAGKKVLGIVKVSTNSDDYESSSLDFCGEKGFYMTRRKSMKSDKLEAATVEESEAVTVVWLIES